jgi:hypothetical protein
MNADMAQQRHPEDTGHEEIHDDEGRHQRARPHRLYFPNS